MSKVIFLDHDGVLFLRKTKFDIDRFFDPRCVEILNEILQITKAEIVVSSDWRLHADLRGLQQLYENDEIIKIPCSITPDLRSENFGRPHNVIRTIEILSWIKEHPVQHWVAVDDMKLNLKYFVQTNEDTGLSGPGVKEKLIEYLNEKNNGI